MDQRVWNFSAGPAQLPKSVLNTAQRDLLSFNHTGMSVMELSHRSDSFIAVAEAAEADLRDLLEIPENYKVLFLQGGASQQFAMVPMNLKQKGKAAYVDTGSWSTKAIKEAQKIGLEVDVIASSQDQNYTYIPDIQGDFQEYDYVHITSNNTIEGTEYFTYPGTGATPLVADMSSDILSRPIDISKFGLIYAGAQKNIGIAGLTVVIIREDLLNLNPDLAKIFNYQTQAEKNSMFNTPPTFPIYIAGLVFKHLKDRGGLSKVEEENIQKAKLIYEYLQDSQLFSSPVKPEDRSRMNIPFVSGDDDLDKKFIEQASGQGLVNLKGHRSVGGMRASIYNAIPLQAVEELIDFMKAFEGKEA